mmetsp:Transcript_49666/g.120404  ORF Transcript_49666/g.120404 Transcript_49666/m.120404 type:complete len:545 (-) Transcript_49666:589-2223(-)
MDRTKQSMVTSAVVTVNDDDRRKSVFMQHRHRLNIFLFVIVFHLVSQTLRGGFFLSQQDFTDQVQDLSYRVQRLEWMECHRAEQDDVDRCSGSGTKNDDRNEVAPPKLRQLPQITYTNVQWFHPTNSEIAETSPRTIAMTKLMEAVMDHPRYNATLWSDLEARNQNPPSLPDHNHTTTTTTAPVPFLAFLDADICHYTHWPNFGADKEASYESGPNGRRIKNAVWVGYKNPCDIIEKALASPALISSPQSRLFVLNCDDEDGESHEWGRECLGPYRDNTSNKYRQLVVGHQSRPLHLVNYQDFGIPPLPVKSVDIERDDVCPKNMSSSLPYLLSFKGRIRTPFEAFHKFMEELSNTRSDVYAKFTVEHYIESPLRGKHNQSIIQATPKDSQSTDQYYQLMTQSKFCPVVRGDNLVSVRFSEVLSAGCIPILYADEWVLPYVQSVVDWSKIAIIIPQRNVYNTMDYIQHMSDEEICDRRLLVYDTYHKYIKDGTARVNAIIKIMDERFLTGGRIQPIQYAPGSSTRIDNIQTLLNATPPVFPKNQ